MTLRLSDVAACARRLGKDAPGLLAASLALPGSARDAALVIGALHAAILDEGRREDADPARVERLRERVLSAYAGVPGDDALDRGVAWLAIDVGMPRLVFDAALEAARWDASGRRYATIENLLDYAVRAGGAPALAVARVLGVEDRAPLACASDLGVGIALVMIARDVGKHARRGRLLLPLEWLEEEGVDVDAWIGSPTPTPAVRRVVARMVHMAEGFLGRSEPGVRSIPRAHRPAIRALRYSYALDAAWMAHHSDDTNGTTGSIPLLRRIYAIARSFRPRGAEQRNSLAFTHNNASFLVDRLARNPVERPL